MNAHRTPAALSCIAIVCVACCVTTAFADGPPIGRFDIPVPSGRLRPPEGIHLEAGTNPRIVVIQFYEHPDGVVRQALAASEVHLLDRLHGTAFFARVDAPAGIEATLDSHSFPTAVRDRIRSVFAIKPRAKIAPVLLRRPPPRNLLGSNPGTIRALVQFHRDVTPADAAQVFGGVPDTLAPSSVSLKVSSFDPPAVYKIEGAREQLLDLAGNDLVRAIRPLPPGFIPLADQLRRSSGCESLQTWADPSGEERFEGFNGGSVKIAVFDCLPTEPNERVHFDLMVDPPNESPPYDARTSMSVSADLSHWSGCEGENESHGDWVTGLIGGSGFIREDRIYRGCAPSVRMSMHPPRPDLNDEFLGSSMLQGYPVSNHSYVTGALVYDDYSMYLDRAVLGNVSMSTDGRHGDHPQVVVVGAGNAGVEAALSTTCTVCNSPEACASCPIGTCGEAEGYFSILGPAKNAVTVGAAWSEEVADRVAAKAANSSMGPTPDGRLKPDVMAPGCSAGIDNGSPYLLVTGVGGENDRYGRVRKCGTSFSAAIVSGIATQIHETWLSTKDPEERGRLWPSTVKAALVQTAADMWIDAPAKSCSVSSPDCVRDLALDPSCDPVEPIDPMQPPVRHSAGYQRGPDYATGFGYVQAVPAAAVVVDRRFAEATLTGVDPPPEWTLSIEIPSGATGLRAALAWDDPEGVPGLQDQLHHDLDLLLLPPSEDSSAETPPPSYGPWVPPFVPWLPLTDEDGGEMGAESSTAGCPGDYCGVDRISLTHMGYTGLGIPPAIRCVLQKGYWMDVDSGLRLIREDGTALVRPYDGQPVPDDDDIRWAISQTCHDRRNNVELVEVDRPDPPGDWTIQVSPHRLDPGVQQDFSVVWGFDLSPAGVVIRDLDCVDLGSHGFEIDAGRLRPAGPFDCLTTKFQDLCDLFPDSLLCGAFRCEPGRCPPFDLDLREWPPEVRVAVIDGNREVVAEESRWPQENRRVTIEPDEAERHSLVLFVEDANHLSGDTLENGFPFASER